MTGPSTVRVRMPAGRLTVRADAGASSVRVVGVRAKLSSDLRAVQAAVAATIELVDGTTVVTVPEPPGRGRAPQVLVEIEVPVGADLSAEVDQAEVVCVGVVGDLVVMTTSGSVHAEEVLGRLSLRTGRGPVTIHRTAGEAVISVSDAGVIIRSAAGPLTVHGRSGDVHVWSLSGPAQISTSTGNVRIGYQRRRSVLLDIESHTGTIDTRVHSDPTAENVLSIRTISGDIRVTSA